MQHKLIAKGLPDFGPQVCVFVFRVDLLGLLSLSSCVL